MGTRVLVVGMGRSGIAAARLAVARGYDVTTTDARPDAPPVDGARSCHGEHRRSDFLESQLVVVSPGVPAAQPDVKAAIDAGIPVIGELAFAARHLPGVPLVGITGTDGKSTTTHLTGQLLAQSGCRAFVGGNLGRPLSEAAGGSWDACVVEVSSYQMELPGELRFHAAAVLNLAPDHLGRHGDMETYAATKCRVFDRMDEGDVALLPADDPLLAAASAHTRARRLGLGATPGVRWEERLIVLAGTPDDGEVRLEGFPLPGTHNRSNLAAAVLLAVCAGARRARFDVAALTGLPHRLEPVAEVDGVRWVDDSKATNVHAATVGIASFPGPLVVLMGGQGKKGDDYRLLRHPLEERSSRVVCFGADGPRISAALPGAEVVARLADAVTRAAELAAAGDTVLLCPGCASFDEFRDFEDRGERFQSLVHGLAGARAAGRAS